VARFVAAATGAALPVLAGAPRFRADGPPERPRAAGSWRPGQRIRPGGARTASWALVHGDLVDCGATARTDRGPDWECVLDPCGQAAARLAKQPTEVTSSHARADASLPW